MKFQITRIELPYQTWVAFCESAKKSDHWRNKDPVELVKHHVRLGFFGEIYDELPDVVYRDENGELKAIS